MSLVTEVATTTNGERSNVRAVYDSQSLNKSCLLFIILYNAEIIVSTSVHEHVAA